MEGIVRGVANRALREALAAHRMEAYAALAGYMAERGWLSPGKRVLVALKRWLGRSRPQGTPALSFDAVLRMYGE